MADTGTTHVAPQAEAPDRRRGTVQARSEAAQQPSRAQDVLRLEQAGEEQVRFELEYTPLFTYFTAVQSANHASNSTRGRRQP
jgi:hypothetical protein